MIKSPTRLLICGDRNWTDSATIKAFVDTIKKNMVVITGGARGVDSLAEYFAKARGIHVARVDALWESYGPAAGTIRNKAMLSLNPSLVVAFHRDLAHSKGTKHCVEEAKLLGIGVIVVDK